MALNRTNTLMAEAGAGIDLPGPFPGQCHRKVGGTNRLEIMCACLHSAVFVVGCDRAIIVTRLKLDGQLKLIVHQAHAMAGFCQCFCKLFSTLGLPVDQDTARQDTPLPMR